MHSESKPDQRQSDDWLIERVLAGQTMAFEGLMRRYNQRLYRVCRGILGNHAAAEDAVQNAYIRAFRKLCQFRGTGTAGAWLCRIARNESLALVRKANQRKSLLRAVEAEGPPRSGPPSPESDFATSELSKAIDALPSRYRVAFVLREIEGLSLSETAELLEIRSGTVKSRVSRARGLLRSRLGPNFVVSSSKTLTFAGRNCDRLVAEVLDKIAHLSR